MKKVLSMVSVMTAIILSPLCYADAILHAFNWTYTDIRNNARQIADYGYKSVLIAPPLKSSGSQWWARYQPQDLRVIDSPLGNKQDLEAMIASLNSHKVAVYADVVLNHMANESSKRDDLNYPGYEMLNLYSQQHNYYANQTLFGELSQNIFSEQDFHTAGCISDWNDPAHVQYWRLCGSEGDTGLPDLDPNNWVVSQHKNYLRALKKMGIRGFRIDAVKHMSQYQIDQIFTNAIIQDMHIFGEIITSGGKGKHDYEAFLAPYLNSTSHSAYDFPLFASIRKAFSLSNGLNLLHDPHAYGQALESSRAITFAITHDIPTNDVFRHQIMDPVDEELAYAYILGRDGGSPLIYSDDLSDNEDKDNGRWANVWKSPTMINMLQFHNLMQGQPMTMINSNHCTILFKRGKEGVVGINKCLSPQSITVDTFQHEFNWYVPYKDALSSDSISITSQYYDFVIPARSARMWMLEH
ncbi:alpha-amylase family protein [Vibrio pectenicida]|uniref:alpha-amylase family protein n=1 Tax=Vibrio pectenicida TaxID=62763 RepID=UPI003B9D28C0